MEFAGVVNLVDEAGKVGCNVLEGFVCHQIHGFDLECLHEALGLGVVVGIAAPAHGAGETVLLQGGAIVIGGILRSTVGMMHATPWWIAGADGGLECSNSEPCIDRAADGLVPRVADSDPARLPRLAAELIEEKVDVVVAVSTAAVRAVQAASTTIPIVAHDLETDPVASGLIASYAQPGGRITGVFFDFPDFRTKWLELLREVIPGLASVGLLWDPVSGVAQLEALQTAADQMRLKTNVRKNVLLRMILAV